MKATSALVFELSRQTTLVLLPNGTAQFIKTGRVLALSDREVKNLERVFAEQAAAVTPVEPSRLLHYQDGRIVGRCSECGADAISRAGSPAVIRHADDCPSFPRSPA